MHQTYLKNWSIPISLAWLGITLVIILVSLAGMFLPQAPSQANVGPYRVAAFPSGLAVFMDTESWHYAISPLNDYVIENTGIRYALLTPEEFTRKTYQNSADRPTWQKVPESALAQLGLRTPWYKFSDDQFSATYTTNKKHNQIRVTRWLRLPADKTYTETGLTFKFNPDDFVFDPDTRFLYTEREAADISQFSEITRLNPIDVAGQMREKLGPGVNLPRWQVEGDRVLVANLAYPGGLQVVAEPGQTIYINPDNSSIEVATTLGTTQPRYFNVTMTIEYVPLLAAEN
jgi:hypothetical protein